MTTNKTKRITAKYPGKCAGCGAGFSVGTQIDYSGPGVSTHSYCQATGAGPTTRRAPPPRAPKVRRQLAAGERQIERKATGKAGGYHVGETLHAGKILGGGGPDGCYWTVMHAFFERANEDNGQYDDLHCAYVRAATDEECAPLIVASRSKLARATCEQWLAAQLAGGVTVSDTGKLPAVADRAASVVLGYKVGASGAVTDGGTTYALTATSVVAHHDGYYDAYRSTTRTVERTDALAQVIAALATNDGAALSVQADRIQEGKS